jgi:hypothetical protein
VNKGSMTIDELKQEVAERAASKIDMVLPTGVLGMDVRTLLQEVDAIVPARTVSVNGREERVRSLGPGHDVLESFGQAATDLALVPEGKTLQVKSDIRLMIPGQGAFPLTDLGHTQLANTLQIPNAFYNRLRAEQPELLGTNVNTLAHARPLSEQRLVRVERGQVRAVLSDSYRPLDNDDLLRFLMPQLEQLVGGNALTFESVYVDDRGLAIKAVSPRRELKVLGDIVQVGFCLENSEVGLQSLAAWPFYKVISCTNLATMMRLGMRKRHTGSRLVGAGAGNGGQNEDWLHYTDDTRRASDEAFFKQTRDLIGSFLREQFLEKMLAPMKAAAEARIYQDPEQAVRVIKSQYDLTDKEADRVRIHYEAADLENIWGLSNAVTRTAQEATDYHRSTDLEKIGGDIITLDPSQWRVIATGKGTI